MINVKSRIDGGEFEAAPPFFLQARPAMKFLMDKTLRFWVDCSYEDRKHQHAHRPKADLIAEILCEYERSATRCAI